MSNVKTTSKSSNVRTRSYKFSLSMIEFINQLPNKKTFWIIGDQLLRSSTSIGANIMEAKSSSSRRDFIRFYQIALKSGNETDYWLNLLKDTELVTYNTIQPLIKEVGEINNMIAASLLTLKNKREI